MKKLVIAMMMVMALTAPATACPQWECQLPLDDYSCGGLHSGCTNTCTDTCTPVYDETTAYTQYIYCPYCGHEMWDCICGSYQEVANNSGYCDYSGDYCDYGDSLNYTTENNCGSGYSMSHWANVRDCYGNIIGQIGTGSSVEVCGADPSNPDRVLVYDYCTGTYGSVLSECVYGGYTWDGTGDNGYYNSYQGGCNENYSSYGDCTAYSGDSGYYGGDCSTGYTDCSSYDGSCGGYGVGGCYDLVRYTEAISIVRQWEMATGACHTLCW